MVRRLLDRAGILVQPRSSYLRSLISASTTWWGTPFRCPSKTLLIAPATEGPMVRTTRRWRVTIAVLVQPPKASKIVDPISPRARREVRDIKGKALGFDWQPGL